MSAPLRPRPISPLAPLADATYVDDLVVVWRPDRTDAADDGPPPTTRTPHFTVWGDHGRLVVHHDVPDEAIDNDLVELLRHELFGPGWVSGRELFERIMTGVVRTSGAWEDPVGAWELYYRNTLARLAAASAATTPVATGRPPSARRCHGAIADFAPVYRRAVEVTIGPDVLELGCCFGFLSLLLADAGHRVVASDISPGTMALLAAVAQRLDVDLETCTTDAVCVPLPDRHADTVLLVHLLEHMPERDGRRVLAEAMRLARRRVVVAVPFEDRPDATFGHVRCFDLATLDEVGAATGWDRTVTEHHGGWLVLDRPGDAGGTARGTPGGDRTGGRRGTARDRSPA